MERNDFMNFARDLYFKREFSKNGVSGQEAMRNAILDALGGEFTPTSWGKNKYMCLMWKKNTFCQRPSTSILCLPLNTHRLKHWHKL